jgi:hypothetical protein
MAYSRLTYSKYLVVSGAERHLADVSSYRGVFPLATTPRVYVSNGHLEPGSSWKAGRCGAS